MPNFPRTIASRITTPPIFPEGFQQFGQSGVGQFRSFDNVGRVWEEVYPAINLLTQAAKQLIMEINRGLREKIIYDIQHPHYVSNFGVGGGTPVVDLASQTGSTINIRNASINTTNWLRAGDIVTIGTERLVYDVRADVNTDGSGDAAVPIHPPIFTGGSPADGAAFEEDAANIFFLAVILNAQMPDIEAHGVMPAGLTVTWREQPS